jgi:hypothetical protein
MQRIVLILCLALAPTLAFAEETTLNQQQWQDLKPRNGQTVAGLAPVRDIVTALDKTPGQHVVIRYPGGDAGNAWAEAVRDWLVALGVASKRIVLEPGSSSPDALTLLTQKDAQ